MRIKVDKNLPDSLAVGLRALGHDADTVVDESLGGRDDRVVWEAAQSEQRFFQTQDLDFSDVRLFPPNAHAGLMLIRIKEPSRRRLSRRVLDVFVNENVEAWKGCYLILTDTKLRVRRPDSEP